MFKPVTTSSKTLGANGRKLSRYLPLNLIVFALRVNEDLQLYFPPSARDQTPYALASNPQPSALLKL